MLLQKAMVEAGASPENIAKVSWSQSLISVMSDLKINYSSGDLDLFILRIQLKLIWLSNYSKVAREMASRAKGSLTPTAATVDALVSAIVTGGIEYDDVVKALNFDKVDFAVLLICLFFVLLQ